MPVRQVEIHLLRGAVAIESVRVGPEVVIRDVRVGSLRQLRLQVLGDGRKTVRGNQVAGEDRAGARPFRTIQALRIVDSYGVCAEIAGPRRYRGKRVERSPGGGNEPESIVGLEEKDPVPHDRAADIFSELVLVFR